MCSIDVFTPFLLELETQISLHLEKVAEFSVPSVDIVTGTVCTVCWVPVTASTAHFQLLAPTIGSKFYVVTGTVHTK